MEAAVVELPHRLDQRVVLQLVVALRELHAPLQGRPAHLHRHHGVDALVPVLRQDACKIEVEHVAPLHVAQDVHETEREEPAAGLLERARQVRHGDDESHQLVAVGGQLDERGVHLSEVAVDVEIDLGIRQQGGSIEIRVCPVQHFEDLRAPDARKHLPRFRAEDTNPGPLCDVLRELEHPLGQFLRNRYSVLDIVDFLRIPEPFQESAIPGRVVGARDRGQLVEALDKKTGGVVVREAERTADLGHALARDPLLGGGEEKARDLRIVLALEPAEPAALPAPSLDEGVGYYGCHPACGSAVPDRSEELRPRSLERGIALRIELCLLVRDDLGYPERIVPIETEGQPDELRQVPRGTHRFDGDVVGQVITPGYLV